MLQNANLFYFMSNHQQVSILHLFLRLLLSHTTPYPVQQTCIIVCIKYSTNDMKAYITSIQSHLYNNLLHVSLSQNSTNLALNADYEFFLIHLSGQLQVRKITKMSGLPSPFFNYI